MDPQIRFEETQGLSQVTTGSYVATKYIRTQEYFQEFHDEHCPQYFLY